MELIREVEKPLRMILCAATQSEAHACKKGFTRALQRMGAADRAPVQIDLLKTGVGDEKARRALLERLNERLAQGDRPDLILSTGYAGAVSDTIPARSWIVATEIYRCEHLYSDEDTVTVEDLERIACRTVALKMEGAVSATLISSGALYRQDNTRGLPKFVGFKADKPIAVDMESAALAEIAGQAGIPFIAVRYVTDSPDHPMPRLVDTITGAMAADRKREKVKSALVGTVQAVLKPQDTVRLMREGMHWQRELEGGLEAILSAALESFSPKTQ